MTEQFVLSRPVFHVMYCDWVLETETLTFYVARTLPASEVFEVFVPEYAGIRVPVDGIPAQAGFTVSATAAGGSAASTLLSSIQVVGTVAGVSLDVDYSIDGQIHAMTLTFSPGSKIMPDETVVLTVTHMQPPPETNCTPEIGRASCRERV